MERGGRGELDELKPPNPLKGEQKLSKKYY